MLAAGLACIAGALVCVWVFVGTVARSDARDGYSSRMARPSRLWLLAAVALLVVGLGLLVTHVVGLWR